MRSRRGARRSVLLAAVLVAGLAPALSAGSPALAATTTRIAGDNRYQTAARISASAFDPGVPVAYVATGASAPDALAGGPAATVDGGPVLLVAPGRVPVETAEELERLRPARIVVLGGTAVVGEAVADALAAFTDGPVERLSGPNRYATAAAISADVFSPGVPVVHIASGLGFADALAAGPVAGGRRGPILLTAPGSLPAETAAELDRLQPREIVVVGGAFSVFPSVEEELRRRAPSFDRAYGTDRFRSAAAVSRSYFTAPVRTAYLAVGADFPDALAGGPAAALAPGPLLLVQKDCIPVPVQAEIDRLGVQELVVLGGTAVVGAGVEQGRVCPASGEPEPATTSGGPSRDYVVEAPDFASEAHSDPWDYSNSEDEHVGTPQMSDAGEISGGQLRFTTAAPFPWIDPVPYLPGSQPLDRDGPSAPIDTSRYTHLSFSMFSSRSVAGAVVWAVCDYSPPNESTCQGATGFQVRPGWNRYDLRLDGTDPNFRAEWTGQALKLRLVLGNEDGVQVRVDWVRLRGSVPAATFAVDRAGGGTNELFWDSNGTLADNTADAPGWGPLGTVSGDTASFPVEQFPPGAYRLYTRSGGVTGPYTEPLNVLPRPRPVIDTPSLVGGDDYATVVRGNPWDFSGLDDAIRIENTCNARIVDGGVLAANNCAREDAIDNPHFTLPQPGPIDANTYHRATVRLRYDGPFGLTGGPTGGAVARLIWYVARDGQATDYNSHDLVVYPGWQTISFDLKTDPPSAIVDEAAKRGPFGWAGEQVVRLRLDPNEDVSARNFYVDSVKLTREERGSGGAFTVQLHDTSGLGRQTATVYLDRDRTGTDGFRLSGAVPLSGAQTSIGLSGIDRGRWWPYVVLDGPAGGAVRYADAPIVIE